MLHRRLLSAGVAVAGLVMLLGSAAAQSPNSYPSKPISLIVPFRRG